MDWSMHLHVNVVRFERSSIHLPRSAQSINPVTHAAPSFVLALNGILANPLPSPLTPAMVLDDSCLVTRDLENYVMREILQFSSINNLRVLLSNEGFHNTQIVYLGGLWVMIELESSITKSKFMKHVGVASWFSRLCNAQSDFVAKERIVWVDIEGVPLHAWSHSTFYKIGSKWGEVMELEASNDDLFARKRLCIKTKQEGNILESFKIIVKGKIFVVRAKELFVWSPMYKDVPEAVHCSNNESVKGVEDDNAEASNLNNLEAESDSEAVFDTYVGDNADEQGSENESVQLSNAKEVSNDPFNIYDLLNKRNKEFKNSGKDTSISYPPGFTPEKSTHNNVDQEVQEAKHIQSHSRSEGCSSRILDDAEKLDERFSSEDRGNGVKHKEGCSILELLDEMIKVGQTMGFSMEGCGILCTWNPKEHHIISDNFVALYGTWIPNRMKLWNGESMVMGDFNEVRQMEERWGSTFNAQGASVFNSFITSSRLIDVQLEGYSFTWAHPLASKMSKLDRFLVTDGLLSLFPHISAVCLDGHLSDHRPILLQELISDFRAIPFWLYHSWFSPPGFEHMIMNAWNSTILVDSNGIIRDLKSKLSNVDKELDQGGVNDDLLLSRMDAMKQLQDVKSSETSDFMQKAKVRWAIEGDENSKFFHGIINRKRANLSVKGIMVDGEWVDEPSRVKDEFRIHFATRFQDPGNSRGRLNFNFPNWLNLEQVSDLESPVSRDEIRNAVWGCGENKSPGPDGFTFEFFRKFWTVVGPDFCTAVEWFFDHGLSINIKKSHLLGVGIPDSIVNVAAESFGCSIMKTPFKYLGVMVGGNMSLVKSWDNMVDKLKQRLSKWKLKTLSIGGRLTLLKSVLGSSPVYNMSLFKVPKIVLNKMEGMRKKFFNGMQDGERKIAWVKWSKVLAAKKHGGLG
nr:RNA-directed DNA polymerase, eukaryota [Tanacetum cinerariifolium]